MSSRTQNVPNGVLGYIMVHFGIKVACGYCTTWEVNIPKYDLHELNPTEVSLTGKPHFYQLTSPPHDHNFPFCVPATISCWLSHHSICFA